MVIFQYAILGQNQRIQQKVLLSILDHGFISIRYFPHYTLQLRNIYYFYRLIHANYVFPHFWKNENNSSNKNLHYYLKILFCRMLIILLQLSNQSSHQRCSVKKGVFRNFTKFTGKHLCLSLFFNKVAGHRLVHSENYLSRLQNRCFPVKKNCFFHRTPMVAASEHRIFKYSTTIFEMNIQVKKYSTNAPSFEFLLLLLV